MKVHLNPNYSIRNESNCSYIIYSGNMNNLKKLNFPVAVTIPPFLGYILTNIGKYEFDSSMCMLSERLNISIDKVSTFVKKMVNNKSKQSLFFKGKEILLPPNILVKNEIGLSYDNSFSEPDFEPLDKYVPKRPGIPLFLNIMVTSKCLTDCVYCYADRSLKHKIDTKLILDIISQGKKNGIINIAISGGDVFAENNWKEILFHLYKNGYNQPFSTKVPLKEEDIRFLSSCGVREIQLSIDSFDSQILHKQLRVNVSYLKKLKNTLLYMGKHKIKVDAKTVLTRYNSSIENIKNMYEVLSSYECINSWNVVPAFCSAYKEGYSYQPNKNDLCEVFNFLDKLDAPFIIYKNKLMNTLPIQGKMFSSLDEFSTCNKGCVANVYSMCVFANGESSVCEMLYYNDFFYLGNIKHNRLKDIWNSSKAKRLYFANGKMNTSKDSPCFSCSSFKNCKEGLTKRICYADIVNSYGNEKWDYPDPRCPNALSCDMEKIITV